MNCPYCGSQNNSEDHRCGRCGRRLNNEDGARRPQGIPVQRAATAPQLEAVAAPATIPERPGPRIVREPPIRTDAPPIHTAAQPSLFGPVAVPKAPAAKVRTAEPAVPNTRPRRNSDAGQTAFEFEAVAGTLPASTIATTCSHAAVAPLGPRITAAVVDLVIPVCGFAIFITAFHLMAGAVEVSARTMQFYGAAALLILLFYRVLCCMASIDTPGMQFAGLRLLNLDGHLPSRRARFLRLGGGFISLASAGLGLLWALFDEDRLAWHDHISGTFPTAR